MTLKTVRFPSGDAECVGDLRLPAGASAEQPVPIVILGHGLGATRAMGLGRYAERFSAAGLATLTFDYRHFGESGGTPRQLLSIPRQQTDWKAAVAFARSLPEIDAARVAVWGSSFGGGHALWMGAEDHDLAAVVAQCPFTDGQASALTLGVGSTIKVTARALADVLGAAVRRPPVRVALAGPRGSAALMTAPDALPGYTVLREEAGMPDDTVAARIGLLIGTYRPGRRAKQITTPTLAIVCRPDTVAPDGATLRHLRRASSAPITVREVPYGHFEIYTGAPFEELVTEQTAFLTEQLDLAAPASRAGAGAAA